MSVTSTSQWIEVRQPSSNRFGGKTKNSASPAHNSRWRSLQPGVCMGNETLRFPYYRKHQKGQLANRLPNAPPELFGSCMWPVAILKNDNSKSLAKRRKEAL